MYWSPTMGVVGVNVKAAMPESSAVTSMAPRNVLPWRSWLAAYGDPVDSTGEAKNSTRMVRFAPVWKVPVMAVAVADVSCGSTLSSM
jgi:hypothetical protein